MTTRQWAIIAVLFAVVVIVFCFGGILIFATLTPPQTQAVAVELTVIPSPFPTDTPTPRPTQTPKPTPTLAVLKMTLDEIEGCCKAMTTIQEKEYLAALVGSRVNWQGTVDDAKPDGTIWVKVSSTRIEMNSAPPEVAAKLSKGQSINFYAIVTKAENSFLVPGVQLRFESMNTNVATANLTQTAPSAPISPNTPQPTSTLKPLTPSDRLAKLAKDGLEKGFGKGFMVLRSAAITGATAVVDYKTTDFVFDQESTVAPYMENLQNIIPQIFSEFSAVNDIEVNQYTMFKDVYGKSIENLSIRIAITRETSSKMDWKGFRAKNLPKVLTAKGDSFFVHPALSSGWTIYQQKY